MKHLFFKLFSIPFLILFIGGAIADNCDDIAVQFQNNTKETFYVTYETSSGGSGNAGIPPGMPYFTVLSRSNGKDDETSATITLFDPKAQKIITAQKVKKMYCGCLGRCWIGELTVPWNPRITFGNYTIETRIQGTYKGTNCVPGKGGEPAQCDNTNPGLVQVIINGP